MIIYKKQGYKRFLYFSVIFLCLFFIGCATTQEISLLDNKFIAINERLDKIDGAINEIEQNDIKLDERLGFVTENLAEITTRIEHEHNSLLILKASFEDYQQLLNKTKQEGDLDRDGLKLRLDRLEEVSKNLEKALNALKDVETVSASEPPKENKTMHANTWEDLDEESFYSLAYQTFQKDDYDTAREIFSAFLDKYPKGKLSDNATFWIGECYYKTNRFEQAILEYEKVKHNYPSGDKVPAAILKQALSFLHLNVKEEAKILLKNLVEHYPESEQAKLAQAELDKMK